MSALKEKKYWDIRLDEDIWKYRQTEQLSVFFFLFFNFIFNNEKKKHSQKMDDSLYFYEKNSPWVWFFGIFWLLTRKRRWSVVQNSFNFIRIDSG